MFLMKQHVAKANSEDDDEVDETKEAKMMADPEAEEDTEEDEREMDSATKAGLNGTLKGKSLAEIFGAFSRNTPTATRAKSLRDPLNNHVSRPPDMVALAKSDIAVGLAQVESALSELTMHHGYLGHISCTAGRWHERERCHARC